MQVMTVLLSFGHIVAFADPPKTGAADFIRLKDVPEAFSRLPATGTKLAALCSVDFPEDIIVVNSNHIQGIALYGEYTIISVNGQADVGYFFFFDSENLLGGFSSPDGLGSHPGCLSVAGDYLTVSQIGLTLIYDISPLKDRVLPNPMPVAVLNTNSNASSIATWQGNDALMIYTGANLIAIPLPVTSASVDSAVTLPVQNRTLPSEYDPPASYNTSTWNADCTALVTDTENHLWYFSLVSKLTLSGHVADLVGQDGVDYEDVAVLYKIEFTDSDAVITGPVAVKKLSPYNAYLLALGCHFRFAASVYVPDENNFAIISTTSLPGNMALSAVSPAFKTIADIISAPALYINAFVTGDSESCNLAYRFLKWLVRVIG
jgi:hypothetical protein